MLSIFTITHLYNSYSFWWKNWPIVSIIFSLQTKKWFDQDYLSSWSFKSEQAPHLWESWYLAFVQIYVGH